MGTIKQKSIRYIFVTLLLIGLALFIGLYVRIAAVSGTLLLVLYYFAYPPFGNTWVDAVEGHWYIVDKNFIEAVALMFIFFVKNRGYGIDTLVGALGKFRSKRKKMTLAVEPEARRKVLKNLAAIPALGFMGWGEGKHLNTYGADFICVGMFDFQVVSDVNTTLDVLGNLNRKRQWYS